MNPLITFTTTRRDGNARALPILRKMLSQKALPLTIATAHQVHGTKIAIVPKLVKPRRYPGTDGLITAVSQQPLGIFTADCAAIFLSAPSQGVIGLLHAGWRGVHGGILSKAFRQIRRMWSCPARDVFVWIGPCIGVCCFEVQWDVARNFPKTRRQRKDRWVVDLKQEIKDQVKQLGGKMLPSSRACTRHHPRYHSFRRDQTDQRQISVIMRRN